MFEAASKDAKLKVLKRIKDVSRKAAMSKIGKDEAESPMEEGSEDMQKEASEHPSFNMEQIRQIVKDHMSKGDNTENKSSGINVHIHMHGGKE